MPPRTTPVGSHVSYGIGGTPAQRLTRKKHGAANAALVMFWPAFRRVETEAFQVVAQLPDGPADPEAEVAWLLLVTPGTGQVAERECLRSVTEPPRPVWLGYELLRQPKHGKLRWTWRRTKQEMADWYAILGEQLASGKMAAVAATLERISHQPGFSGVRRQSWELVQFARARGYAGETPYLYFMQKVGHGARLPLVGSPG